MGQKWLIVGVLIAVTCSSAAYCYADAPKVPVASAPAEGARTASPEQSQKQGLQPEAGAQARCDAAPWRRLVGRTMSDLLTVKLPPQSRIYRVGDPITIAVVPNRLQVEVNRGTRVSRVYCS